MNLPQAIHQVLQKQDLNTEQMTQVMQAIMTGGATDAQIGGFLVGLRMKGESVTEITAAASVMRELANGVDISNLPHTVDIVGTGGDASGTFNISTASIFVAAAASCHVAKHGNRSVSSQSGSADALEAIGVNLMLKPEHIAQCVRETGLGFMFAPNHHSAMKHAIGPRKEMAVRTLFNVLGPLTNPANTPNLLLGVFSAELLLPLAEVLRNLGAKHVLVVHSNDGLDEISISDSTQVAELRDDSIERYTIAPEDFGLNRAPLQTIKADSPQQSAAIIRDALSGTTGPASDIIALNAGAAIYTAGVTDSLSTGVARAQEMLANGVALQKLEQLVKITQTFA